jgi:hypothetical protein
MLVAYTSEAVVGAAVEIFRAMFAVLVLVRTPACSTTDIGHASWLCIRSSLNEGRIPISSMNGLGCVSVSASQGLIWNASGTSGTYRYRSESF